MAFRTEALAFAAGLFAASILTAQSTAARHDHWHSGGSGTLTVSEQGVSWEESGKKAEHSRKWAWDEIQQLELSKGRVRLLGYVDEKWKGWRDQEYVFDGVAEPFVEAAGPVLREHLLTKYVAALAKPVESVEWRIPVKLRARLGGSEGALLFKKDQLLYATAEREESRTWNIADIESVSSGDRYELTVETLERAGWTRGPREFHFQLKQPISEAQYQELWKSVNRAKGIALIP